MDRVGAASEFFQDGSQPKIDDKLIVFSPPPFDFIASRVKAVRLPSFKKAFAFFNRHFGVKLT
jgi:hypothetical protein